MVMSGRLSICIAPSEEDDTTLDEHVNAGLLTLLDGNIPSSCLTRSWYVSATADSNVNWSMPASRDFVARSCKNVLSCWSMDRMTSSVEKSCSGAELAYALAPRSAGCHNCSPECQRTLAKQNCWRVESEHAVARQTAALKSTREQAQVVEC